MWIYDFRTGQHFTLKTRRMTRDHLEDFVEKYKPGRRHEREKAENFKRWTYDELPSRPHFSFDVWASVVDHSLDDPESLPAPSVLAEEIVATVSTALESFAALAAELNGGSAEAAQGETCEE